VTEYYQYSPRFKVNVLNQTLFFSTYLSDVIYDDQGSRSLIQFNIINCIEILVYISETIKERERQCYPTGYATPYIAMSGLT
jgi:hypothetical protein